MISANVIKGVYELLEVHGLSFTDENFGDVVARNLNISNQQSELLLKALHDGATTKDAAAAAGIDPAITEKDVLIAIARAIGIAAGQLQSQ